MHKGDGGDDDDDDDDNNNNIYLLQSSFQPVAMVVLGRFHSIYRPRKPLG